MPASTALVPSKVGPFLLKSVGVLKREYGSAIKPSCRKIGVGEGDPSEIDSSEVDIAGNAVEHGIGAGKVGPFLLSSVGVLKGEYGSYQTPQRKDRSL